MRSRGRHDIIGFGRENSAHEHALLRFAGDDRMLVGILARSVGTRGIVETQFRLPAARVRAMALEATVRQDRPDIAIITKRLRAESKVQSSKFKVQSSMFG